MLGLNILEKILEGKLVKLLRILLPSLVVRAKELTI